MLLPAAVTATAVLALILAAAALAGPPLGGIPLAGAAQREASVPRLAFRSEGRWYRATRRVRERFSGRTGVQVYATGDPGGRRIEFSYRFGRSSFTRIRARGGGPEVEAVRVRFPVVKGERYLGFGERSNAVDQRGNEVENLVQEGPFQDDEYPIIDASIPDWALFNRPDASYFPMPWLLSTAGYGLLVENLRTSRFRLGSRAGDLTTIEVDGNRLALRVFLGRPATLVRELTRVTGRQPRPAAPWLLGPWFQTGHQNTSPGELGYARTLRRADAPVSAAETHMRYMPCGADRAQEPAERARTRGFHRLGLATLTYLREAVCAGDPPAFDRGLFERIFLRRADGSAYTFPAFVGGGVTDVGMIDFGNPAADGYYASLLRRPLRNGYDGWMEDYGEYVPPDSVSANGRTGQTMRNLYPVLYHRSGWRFARAQRRPLVRFIRSGWTGVHPYAQVVWGGDPTTGWGFDGLRSSVTQALTMGLSGISLWGSDIGGFFTLGDQRLTPELLTRWLQFGAVSGVMRTKAEGIGTGQDLRPQIWQPRMLPRYRRWAKLRTQLYPYLVAADAEYRRSGLPMMRHLALAYPGDRRAVGTEDAFLFGPDLLAAPVTRPGQRRRQVYLPRGRWVDLWRSLDYRPGSGGLRLGRVSLLPGRRRVTLPAPLDELPLLARAGALLPMLPPDVDTLAGYGRGRGLVHAADRRDRLDLLAFPRGDSSGGMGARGRVRSSEDSTGWTLRLSASRRLRVRLRASMATLERPLIPATVLVGQRRLPRRAWSYDRRRQVLSARFAARNAIVRVRGDRAPGLPERKPVTG